MKEHSDKFITLSQHHNKWQSDGELKLDPTHISYIEDVDSVSSRLHHSKVHTIFGQIIEVGETPEIIEDIVNDWYDEIAKSERDKIVLTKDDIVKNFVFRSLQQ